jgi:guanylate kinase
MKPIASNDLLSQLRAAVASYQIAPQTIEKLQSLQFVVLAAITGSGRNTIVRELLKTGRYSYIVSDTTRRPRVNDGIKEQNGVEYWFRSEADALADVKAGKYVEVAINHKRYLYGNSIKAYDEALSTHKIAITDVDTKGADTFHRVKSDVMAIFVLPPSYEEWRRRLMDRGDMTDEEFTNRVQSARAELTHALETDFYHFVINDDLDQAVKAIDELATGKEATRQDALGKQVAADLLAKLA